MKSPDATVPDKSYCPFYYLILLLNFTGKINASVILPVNFPINLTV